MPAASSRRQDVDQLYARPAHPYTAALLRSIPRVDREVAAVQPIAGRPPDLIAPPPGCAFHPRCGFAQDRCRRERPPLEAVTVDGATGDKATAQKAACWFPFIDKGPDADLSTDSVSLRAHTGASQPTEAIHG